MLYIKTKKSLKTTLCGVSLCLGLASPPAMLAGPAYAESPTVEVVEVQAPDWVPAQKDVMPVYPKSMLKKGIEGSVTLAYEIDKRGKAHKFRVIEAEPTRVFVRSAKIALQKSRFEVTKVNGRPITVRDQQRSYIYSLDRSTYVAAAPY